MKIFSSVRAADMLNRTPPSVLHLMKRSPRSRTVSPMISKPNASTYQSAVFLSSGARQPSISELSRSKACSVSPLRTQEFRFAGRIPGHIHRSRHAASHGARAIQAGDSEGIGLPTITNPLLPPTARTPRQNAVRQRRRRQRCGRFRGVPLHRGNSLNLTVSFEYN
jgi:hypothetical protein